ncbi:MAG: AmmeMemoRadiSam system protein B [Candidatus Moraniibacteriota bacterium]|nr:MAG: AmmeMemoRadiSam system protein B [Candidatus Moranbacteria bacterium]
MSNFCKKVIIVSVIMWIAGAGFLWWVLGTSYSEEELVIPEVDTVRSCKKMIDLRQLNNVSVCEEIALTQKRPVSKEITAIIVPHHLLAKEMIEEVFSATVNQKYDRIFLVGPDHFNRLIQEKFTVAVCDASWKICDKEVFADEKMINQLNKNDIVQITWNPFYHDHAVLALLPYISQFHPDAKIVPMLVRQDAHLDSVFRLGYELQKIDGGNSLFVISSDFSHGRNNAKEVERVDQKSIESIQQVFNGDRDSINFIENDCKACIAFLEGFFSEKTGVQFTLLNNKNSTHFGGPQKKITSYVTGYFFTEK